MERGHRNSICHPSMLFTLPHTSTSASSTGELKDSTSSRCQSGRPDSRQPKKSRRSTWRDVWNDMCEQCSINGREPQWHPAVIGRFPPPPHFPLPGI